MSKPQSQQPSPKKSSNDKTSSDDLAKALRAALSRIEKEADSSLVYVPGPFEDISEYDYRVSFVVVVDNCRGRFIERKSQFVVSGPRGEKGLPEVNEIFAANVELQINHPLLRDMAWYCEAMAMAAEAKSKAQLEDVKEEKPDLKEAEPKKVKGEVMLASPPEVKKNE